LVNIPSVSTKTVFCSKVTVTCTNVYLSGKNLQFEYGYAINQETVMGSNDPIMATGEFRGTIEFEFLACTDSDLHDWVTPSAGQIAIKTLTFAEVDTQSAAQTRTWTIYARYNNYQETARENDFIRGRIRGVLTDEPTEAVA